MDTRPTVVTVPTELGREDAWIDGAILAGAFLFAWYMFNRGLVWWSMPVLIAAATWTLTGEPAGDVQFLGAIAAGLRSKLGLRRAHEWVLAWWHYTRIVTLPRTQRWVLATRIISRLRRTR